MPLPAAINGAAFHNIANVSLTFANPFAHGSRQQLTRSFHVYLEMTMQSKHDDHQNAIRAYCNSKGLGVRIIQGASMVAYQGGWQQFYAACARVAAEMSRDHMVARWTANGGVGKATVFTPGARVDCAAQRVRQRDNLHYETSYFYDSSIIYVAFHCYP